MKAVTNTLRARVAFLTSFALAFVLLALWSTAAFAQSREDQYGSPTDPVEHATRASDALSVLPETGGPMIVLVGAALILVGTGLAIVGRRTGRR